MQRAQLVASAAVFAGLLHLHYEKFLREGEYQGTLPSLYESVVKGTANAPYQYRILVPRFVVWLHHLTDVTYRLCGVVVDGAALFAGGIVLLALATAFRLERYALALALYVAFIGFNTTLYSKPETMTAFFGASLMALAFVRDDERGSAIVLAVSAVVLAGTRIDVLAAFSVAYLARWWWERRTRDLVCAVALVLGSFAALAGLIWLYPDARYPTGLSLVQLGHNAGPGTFLIPLIFLFPTIVPLFMVRRSIRGSLGNDVSALAAAIAVFSLATFVLGRVEEIRLWFPLAGVIACVAAAAWIAAGTEVAAP